jgi:hypothetical protein
MGSRNGRVFFRNVDYLLGFFPDFNFDRIGDIAMPLSPNHIASFISTRSAFAIELSLLSALPVGVGVSLSVPGIDIIVNVNEKFIATLGIDKSSFRMLGDTRKFLHFNISGLGHG